MFSLFLNVLIPNAIGILSSSLSSNTREQYFKLKLPKLHPPGWVFGVVWIIMYTLMGVAAYLAIQQASNTKELILIFCVYGIKLFFNFYWSIIFFRYMKRGLALMWIIALDILVIITSIIFYQFSALAGLLMLPYIFWVLFATWLNYAIWRLNREK